MKNHIVKALSITFLVISFLIFAEDHSNNFLSIIEYANVDGLDDTNINKNNFSNNIYSLENYDNTSSFSSKQDKLIKEKWPTVKSNLCGFSIDYPPNSEVKIKTNRFDRDFALVINYNHYPNATYPINLLVDCYANNNPVYTNDNLYETIKNESNSFLMRNPDVYPVEDLNDTKWIIDGRKTVSEITGRELPRNITIGDETFTFINGDKVYFIHFSTDANYFDLPMTQEIEKKMIMSFKLLNKV